MTGPDASAAQAAHIDLQVAITGAFLTGRPVHLSIGEYQQRQRDLLRHFESQPGDGWSVNTDHWRRDGTYSSGGGFTSMLAGAAAELKRLVWLKADPLSCSRQGHA